jgi:hypothetical protein
LENNEPNLAKLKKLELNLQRLPPQMSSQTYLALVRHSKVQKFRNFGEFLFSDLDMVTRFN